MKKRVLSWILCLVLVVGLLPVTVLGAGVLPTAEFYTGDYVTYGGASVEMLALSGNMEGGTLSNNAYIGKITLTSSTNQSLIKQYCNYDPASYVGPQIRLRVSFGYNDTEEIPYEGWTRTTELGAYVYKKEKTFFVKNYPYALPGMENITMNYTGQEQAVSLPQSWRPSNAVADGAYANFTVQVTDENGTALPISGGSVRVKEKGTYTVTYTFDPATRENAQWWCVREAASQENGWTQVGNQWQRVSTITVQPVDITSATVTLGESLTYNGQAQTPTLSVKLDGNVLTQGVDYDVAVEAQKNVGTYQVKLTGKGGITGEKTMDWSIEPADINNAEATGLSVEYNGRLQGDEQVVLSYGGITLKSNVDYWCYQGSSSADVGSYKQVFRGAGNFTGSKEVYVEIVPKELTVVDVLVKDKAYDGTKAAEIQEVILDGILSAEDVTVDYAASTAEFADAAVGTDKAVTGEIHLKGTSAGNYQSPIAYTTTADIINDFYPQKGGEYTVSHEDWTNETVTIYPAEGYAVSSQKDGVFGAFLSVDNEDQTEFTFYIKDEARDFVSNPVTETIKIDHTAPTAEANVGGNSSGCDVGSELSKQYFNRDVTVELRATDALSGVESVQYFVSDKELTMAEVEAVTQWTTGDSVTLTAGHDKQYVVYARAEDKAGNVGYRASDMVIFDTQAPKILGPEDGGVYYGSVEVSVDDTPGAFLRKGGGVVRHPYLLSGEVVGAHMFQSEDKAGNIQRVEFEIRAVSTLEEELKDITLENVKLDDADVIEQVLQAQAGNAATEAEKAALKDVKDKAEELMDRLEALQKAAETESINSALDMTEENVSLEDEATLEQAIEDIEKLLEDFDGNLTEEHKEHVQEVLKQLEDALEIVEDAKAVQDMMDALPETAQPDDETAVKAAADAKAAYDKLTEHGKSLVDDTALDALRKALAAYKIVKGDDDKWTGSGELSFTANGALSKFTEIKVDGKAVNKEDYTAKAGSTIVTLKESFLKGLKEGEHKLTVCYTDGSAEGSFTVAPATSGSGTGESIPMPDEGGSVPGESIPMPDEGDSVPGESMPAPDKPKDPAVTPGTGDIVLPVLIGVAGLALAGIIVLLIIKGKQKKK